MKNLAEHPVVLLIRHMVLSTIVRRVADYLRKQDPAQIKTQIAAGINLADALERELRSGLSQSDLEAWLSRIRQYLHLFNEEDVHAIFDRAVALLDQERRGILEANRAWCLQQLRLVWRRLLQVVPG